MKMLKKKFKRSIEELKSVFRFIDDFTQKHEIRKSVVQDVSLAVEEIFTNMVKYNPDGPSEVEMGLTIENNAIRIEMTDREVDPFDITKAEVYDLNRSVEDRPIGRLGIYFVKNVMDQLKYDHQNEQTVITMIKNLGETNV